MATTPTGHTLGTDFACIDDIDSSLTLVSGPTQLGHALARRIGTPRLHLFYDSEYGVDARDYLHRPWRSRVTSQAVESQCVLDERVDNCAASVTFVSAQEATQSETPDCLTIDLRVATKQGPFEFTLAITDVTAELLKAR